MVHEVEHVIFALDLSQEMGEREIKGEGKQLQMKRVWIRGGGIIALLEVWWYAGNLMNCVWMSNIAVCSQSCLCVCL